MGKVHMGMARSGKVKYQTPKQPKAKKPKKKTGRAAKRLKGQLHEKKAREEIPFKEAIFSETPELALTNPAKVGFDRSSHIGPDPVEEFHLRTALEMSMLEAHHKSHAEEKGKEKETSRSQEEPDDESKEEEPTSCVTLQPQKVTIERDLLKKMLERENEIRLSAEIQDRYTNMKLSGYKEAGEQYEGFLIDNGIQIQVLKEFGFAMVEPEDYRAQCMKLKETDEEIKNACLWLKFDIMRSGDLRVGDAYVDCPLVKLDEEPTKLSDFINPNRPLIVVGGSYT